MLLAEHLPYARIYWLDEIKSLRVQYLDLFGTLDDWKKVWASAGKIMYQKKTAIWIHNSYESKGVFSNEVQKYVEETLLPQGVQNGLKMVLTINPEEVGLETMTNRKWQSAAQRTGFIHKEFKSLEEIKTWLKSQNA